MSWWERLTGKEDRNLKPKRLDYLSEALALERQGDVDAALTSYRLALRDRPNDVRVLENMAIAFSKIGQIDDAIRSYRRALEIEPKLSGAHYGLAFLLIKKNAVDDAAFHLEAFLLDPPTDPDASRWIAHARRTLGDLRTSGPAAMSEEEELT
jgi:tetratricopeptide (TPR) repeat protein